MWLERISKNKFRASIANKLGIIWKEKTRVFEGWALQLLNAACLFSFINERDCTWLMLMQNPFLCLQRRKQTQT